MFPKGNKEKNLCQRFSAEYRENVEITVICDMLHVHQSLHICVGDHEIDVGIVCHVLWVCSLWKCHGAKLDDVVDAELSRSDMVLFGHFCDCRVLERLAVSDRRVCFH